MKTITSKRQSKLARRTAKPKNQNEREWIENHADKHWREVSILILGADACGVNAWVGIVIGDPFLKRATAALGLQIINMKRKGIL